MPQVFRVMIKDSELPKLGSGDNMLGVRIPPHPRKDVQPDENGKVRPKIGGLSVNPSIKKIPLSLVPTKYNSIRPGARGSDAWSVWGFGEGSFADSKINDRLNLRVDKPNQHGLLEPSSEMNIDDFQLELSNTQEGWKEFEITTT